MPLQSGSSEATVQSNLKEVYKSYKKSGKIGTSRPKSRRAALKQSIAIAYSKARKSNGKSKRTKS